MRILQHAASLIGAAFILAACGGSAAVTPTQPTATQLPIAEATSVPTTAPTIEATTAPTSEASAAILPAPLYTTIRGQVVRIERDGTTQTKITDEPSDGAALAIIDLAVSTDGSALIYQTQKPQGGSALIRTDQDGGNRTVIFDRTDVSAGNPVWSPDGTNIAVRTSGTVDEIGGGGLYLLPSNGGEPKLLQASSVISATDTAHELNPNDVGYIPLTFSPDGTRILASRYALQLEQCGLAIISVAGGDPVLIEPPSADLGTICGPAVWSADGSAVYTTFVPKGGPYSASAGLWRIDAASGEATPVVPFSANGEVALFKTLFATTSGQLRALSGSADTVPYVGEGGDIAYHMVRIDPSNGTQTQISDEAYTDAQVLWSPDGSGALVQTLGTNGLTDLFWQPLDGNTSIPIGAQLELTNVVWGHP